MTRVEEFGQAPANIVFPVTLDVARIAREIGEELLRPFEVELARTEIRARADSFWNAANPGTLSVTAVGVDGTLVTRFSTRRSWPHDQQAVTALEAAISNGQAKWADNVASYTLTLHEPPSHRGVFRN